MKLFLSVILIVWIPFAVLAEQDVYKLGNGDRLEVRIVTWSEGERAFVRSNALSGSYLVQSDGTVTFPVIGTVAASGKSIGEVTEHIAALFQDRSDAVVPPSITIEVSDYRPFYIMGDVGRPGAYPARPGLTVLQAYALAGGSGASSQLPDAGDANTPEVVRTMNALDEVSSSLARSRIRKSRLEAEVDGVDSIEFPAKLSHPGGDSAIASIKQREIDIFESRKTAFQLEAENLEELKQLLEREIDSIEAATERLRVQQETARKTLANMQQLKDRGFARETQISQAQNEVFALEGKESDLQDRVFRANQRIAEANRDLVNLRTQSRARGTSELQQENREIERLVLRQSMLFELLSLNGIAASDASVDVATTYFLTAEGETTEQVVWGNYRIEPGDIIRVQRSIQPVSQDF